MKLMTKEIAKRLPALMANDAQGEDAIAHVKWFTPDSSWTWYVSEYDPESCRCFGLVCGLETEYGYFTLSEIESLRGPLGLPVERDLYWDPRPLRDCPGS